MRPSDGLLSHIGRTPFIRLKPLEVLGRAQVWAKLEFMNPGGSIKDRICLGIVEHMEANNLLRPGDTLVEASAGNTAISLAIVAAIKKYSLKLVMPDSIPVERRWLLSSYGAEIVFTPVSHGMKGALNKVTEMLEATERAFTINQFENPLNAEIHRLTTGFEILNALGRAPDVFVAGVGTGGTLSGVGSALKARNKATRVVAVEPAESPVLSGGDPGPHRIPGIGPGFVPKVLNTDIIDDVAAVTYDEAMTATKMLAETSGLLVGPSSGAAIHASIRQAERFDSDRIVVTVLCDSGERYLCFGR